MLKLFVYNIYFDTLNFLCNLLLHYLIGFWFINNCLLIAVTCGELFNSIVVNNYLLLNSAYQLKVLSLCSLATQIHCDALLF